MKIIYSKMTTKVTILLLALFAHNTIHACECAEIPLDLQTTDRLVEYKLDHAEMVFMGKIAEINSKDENTDLITFEVIEIFKGKQTNKITMEQFICLNYPYRPGRKYLVYSNYISVNNLISAVPCWATKVTGSEPKWELEGLRKLTKQSDWTGIK